MQCQQTIAFNLLYEVNHQLLSTRHAHTPATANCSLSIHLQIVALFVQLAFLGQAFTMMLVYVWSRRNPYIRMNFFGLMNFQVRD